MARVRAKCSASGREVNKIFRANLLRLEETTFDGPFEEETLRHEGLLQELIAKSSCPSERTLRQGLKAAFPDQQVDHAVIAKRLLRCFQWLRRKAKAMTTGTRTPEHVRRLSQQLREATCSKKNEGQGFEQAVAPTEAESMGRKEVSAEVAALFDLCPSGTCVAEDYASPQSASQIAALFDLPSALLSVPVSEEVEAIASSAIGVESSQEGPTKGGAPKMQSGSAVASPPYWDHGRMTMTRLGADGAEEVGVPSEGPDGFILVAFGSEVVQSEVPNLYLSQALSPSCGGEPG